MEIKSNRKKRSCTGADLVRLFHLIYVFHSAIVAFHLTESEIIYCLMCDFSFIFLSSRISHSLISFSLAHCTDDGMCVCV